MGFCLNLQYSGKFAIFTDSSAAAKIRTTKISSHVLASTKSSAGAKFRAVKIIIQ